MIEIQFFKELDSVISVSSREKQVRNLLKIIGGKYQYKMVFDNLGSTFIHIPSTNKNSKRVMISFPMDELGYMVSQINDDGSISIVSVSNQTSVNLLGKKMILETRTGKQYQGYTSFHHDLQASTKNQLELKEEQCRVYFGFTSKEQLVAAGINIGDSIVIEEPFNYLAPLLIGRALEVKMMLFVTKSLIDTIAKLSLPFDLYIGGVVQEKVAFRGSVSSTTTIKPDINLSLTLESEAIDYKIGSGVFIKSYDKTTLPNRMMYDFIMKKGDVHPHVSAYGTSASFIHKSLTGVPSVVLGIHGKNIGLNTMICHEDDIISLIEVLNIIITSLTNSDINEFKGSEVNE